MNKKELKEVFAAYYGLGSSMRGEKVKIEIVDVEDAGEASIKIPWEEHIGNISGVARISPFDIIYYERMKINDENIRKAIEIMKGLAKKNNLYLTKDSSERYLLINPKYRR